MLELPLDRARPAVQTPTGANRRGWLPGELQQRLREALALGADAVMIGRAYLYALGAAGERGVDWVLDFLAEGLRRSLALSGRPTLATLDPSALRRRNPS